VSLKPANNVEVQDEGVSQGFVRALNFTGAGVTATVAGSVATVTVPGGGAGSTITEVTPVFAYSSKRQVFTIVDAAISALSKLIITLGTNLLTGDNADDDIELLALSTVPGAGSAEVYANFLTPVGGAMTFNYMVG